MPAKIRERRNLQLEALCWPDEDTEEARLPVYLAAWEAGHPQCEGGSEPGPKTFSLAKQAASQCPGQAEVSGGQRWGEGTGEQEGVGRVLGLAWSGSQLWKHQPPSTHAQVLGKRTTHPSLGKQPSSGVGEHLEGMWAARN